MNTLTYKLIRPLGKGIEAKIYEIQIDDTVCVLRICKPTNTTILNLIQSMNSIFFIKMLFGPFVAKSNTFYMSNRLIYDLYNTKDNSSYQIDGNDVHMNVFFKSYFRCERILFTLNSIVLYDYKYNTHQMIELINRLPYIESYIFLDEMTCELRTINPNTSNNEYLYLPKFGVDEPFTMKFISYRYNLTSYEPIMISAKTYETKEYQHEIYEKADMTLEQYIKSGNYNSKITLSIILQVLLAIKEMQDNYMIVHQDLHSSNIMIKKIDNPVEYKSNTGGEYTFKNILVKIIDFTWACCYKPGLESKPFQLKDELKDTFNIYYDKPYDKMYDVAVFFYSLKTLKILPYFIDISDIKYNTGTNKRPMNTLTIKKDVDYYIELMESKLT